MIYFIVFFFLLVLFFLIYKIPFVNSLPVLMYHSISKNDISDLTVLESELEKQFKYLKDNDYETIFYSEIDKRKKQVLITFDDGYVNNFDLLIPLLIQFNFKATIFIPFEFIGKKDYWWTNTQAIMSVEVLKKLNPKYVQLGWHSYSHQSYKSLTIEQIKDDLIKSSDIISSNSLAVSPVFAYPFGKFPKNRTKQKELFNLFEDIGIKFAFRIGNKLNYFPIKENYMIKRIDIRGTDSYNAFRWKMKFGRLKPF
ncbi:MAG: polysaccharide deacetylase family protein [Flavobacterium sp.]